MRLLLYDSNSVIQ